jgi:hypothetical protein
MSDKKTFPFCNLLFKYRVVDFRFANRYFFIKKIFIVMGPEVIVATLVPLSFFALVFGIVYMRNRENMALIERGMNPRQQSQKPRNIASLKYGLLMTGAGAGMAIAYIIDLLLIQPRTTIIENGLRMRTDDNPAIYFALIAIGGGLGLARSYAIEKKEMPDMKDTANN